ncbi:MAG: hypothetical protein J6W81_03295 [Lentisphaeria bacterium]|nr:hypothetical protein [Lentisphaeria bacterium]
MKIKKIAVIVALFTMTVMLTGASSCGEAFVDFMEDPEKAMANYGDRTTRYVLTVHELIKYKRADILELDVDSFFGGTVCVNKNHFIHSRDIMKIEKVPRPGNTDFFDLRVTLSSRGHKLWSAMAITRYEGKQVGILIDGIFYRKITPAMILDPESTVITIEGPFDPATAAGLEINSERNYKILNNE